MKIKFVATLLVLAVSLGAVGCHQGNRTEEGALIGGGAGAGAGLIATAAGASPWWILGGAAIGAVGGAIIGHEMDHADQDRAWQDHYAHCHAQHYQCVHCGAVFCNSNACPSCHANEFRIYNR